MRVLVLTLSTIICCFFTGNFEKNTDSEIFHSNYFPVNTDKVLIYESNFGETKFSIEKSDEKFVITNESDDFNYKQTILKKDGKYFITKTEQDVDVFLFLSSSSKVTYNEPALRFPFPLKGDATWEWKGFEYVDDDSSMISIKGEALGIEKIKVPAGEFDCLKIQTEIGGIDESKDVVTEWLAPDVGLVKIEAKVGKGGIVGLIQSLFGLEILTFELKEIISQ